MRGLLESVLTAKLPTVEELEELPPEKIFSTFWCLDLDFSRFSFFS
jgi:hypothetical protein